MKTSEIATLINGELFGNGDVEIDGIANLSTASISELSFYDRQLPIPDSEAGCVIFSRSLFANTDSSPNDLSARFRSLVVTDDAKYSFAVVAEALANSDLPTGWHETAMIVDPESRSDIKAKTLGAYVVIREGSSVGDGTVILDGVKIGRNVMIGKNCVIYPNSTIYDGVTIGDNCILHSGVVIGADGFGFVRGTDGKYKKFPQVGNVIIGNDVEIGANTCIDRGSLGDTIIGDGTKIDNLVQIAHNVSVGKNVVIAAQTGISGSTVIEDNCVIGGQVGIGDHATLRSGAVIGSQAGILPGKIVRPGVWWGTPVQPLDDLKRQNAQLKSISRMKDEISSLKKKIDSTQD